MRLINTRTLEIEDFTGRNIPDYAIASHVWSREEVSFQEFKSGQKRDCLGWMKIKKLCQMARDEAILSKIPLKHDNIVVQERRLEGPEDLDDVQSPRVVTPSTARLEPLDWAWIDTCCINKSSSSELDESITSMFKWYHISAVCFIFLPDVPAEEKIQQTNDVRITLVAAEDRFAPFAEQLFRQSKWFRRGWTLQELIAPNLRLFVNTDFEVLGWLGASAQWQPSLLGIVSQITGIDPEVLTENNAYEGYSVAQRMSWAADRRTTKEEDIAYSLVGLFGVRMSFSYGEGARSAFLRLQAKIISKRRDDSIFAWQLSETEGAHHEAHWPEHTHGLLAPSPLAFKQCSRIKNRDPASTQPGPFTLSDGGIGFPVKIPQRLRPRNSNHFMYIFALRCYEDRHSTSRRHGKGQCYLKLIVKDDRRSLDEQEQNGNAHVAVEVKRTGSILCLDADFDIWEQWRYAQKQALGWSPPTLLQLSDFERGMYEYMHYKYDPHPLKERFQRIWDVFKMARTVRLYASHNSR